MIGCVNMKKKLFIYGAFLTAISFIFTKNVNALSTNLYFAQTDADCIAVFGQDGMDTFSMLLSIFRWAVTIVLVSLVSFDFVKAVTGSKPDEDLKKSTQKALKRALVAVLIFLFPPILNLLLGILDVSICGL